MKKTLKKNLDDAVECAYSAFIARLAELGVEWDDCDEGIFIDDNDSTAWRFNASLTECDGNGDPK